MASDFELVLQFQCCHYHSWLDLFTPPLNKSDQKELPPHCPKHFHLLLWAPKTCSGPMRCVKRGSGPVLHKLVHQQPGLTCFLLTAALPVGTRDVEAEGSVVCSLKPLERVSSRCHISFLSMTLQKPLPKMSVNTEVEILLTNKIYVTLCVSCL